MKNNKNKLLSLLIIACLSFVGCSKSITDEKVDTLLINDTVNVVEIEDSTSTDTNNLDSEQIDDVVEFVSDEPIDGEDITDDTTQSQETTTNETIEYKSFDNTDLTEEITDNIDEIDIEHTVEVLEAYVEVAETHGYSLSYNLTNNIDIESHIFDQVNELRVSLGMSPVTSNNILVGAAFTRAKELPELFSHTRPDGSDWYTVFDNIPYIFKNCGENLTTGTGLTREQAYNKIFDSWYNSPGHYANMVNPDFKEIGIAVYFDPSGTYYATQIFGTEF